MHLHNYAWNLGLTTTELRIVSKALAGDELTPEEEDQAQRLAGNIKTIYAVKRKRPKNSNGQNQRRPNQPTEDDLLEEDHEPLSVETEE